MPVSDWLTIAKKLAEMSEEKFNETVRTARAFRAKANPPTPKKRAAKAKKEEPAPVAEA